MPQRLNTPAAEKSLRHGRSRGIWSEPQLAARSAMVGGPEPAEVRAPSRTWNDAVDLNRAAATPVPDDDDTNVMNLRRRVVG